MSKVAQSIRYQERKQEAGGAGILVLLPLLAGAVFGVHAFRSSQAQVDQNALGSDAHDSVTSLELANYSLPAPAPGSATINLRKSEARQIKFEASNNNNRVTQLHERMGSAFHRVRSRGADATGIKTVLFAPQTGILGTNDSRSYQFNGYLGYRDRETGVNIEAGLSLSRSGGVYVPFMRVNSHASQQPKYFSNGSLRHASHKNPDKRIDRWSNLDLPYSSDLATISAGQKLSMELVRSGENSLTFIIRPAIGEHSKINQGKITISFPDGSLSRNTQFRRVVAFDSAATKSSFSPNHVEQFSSVRINATELRDTKLAYRAISTRDTIQDINHERSHNAVFSTALKSGGGQHVLFELGGK